MTNSMKFGIFQLVLAVLLVIFLVHNVSSGVYANMDELVRRAILHQTPTPPAQAFTYSIFRTAPLDIAKVFGRTPGCADADADFIQATARAAIEAGLDPSIAAATVGIESSCNQFAVSNRGAVGIMQIVPKIWKSEFDFAGDVNLFNRDTNLRVGSKILAGLINDHGVTEGIHRYNGTGTDCAGCDPGYTTRILALAGRR